MRFEVNRVVKFKLPRHPENGAPGSRNQKKRDRKAKARRVKTIAPKFREWRDKHYDRS